MQLESLIQKIVEDVKHVKGVKAIVLGGSRARGTHTSSSDIDLGIYYHPDTPLDLQSLGQLATELDDQHRPDVITGLGGWGPWINGGGWLKIDSHPVDLIYRDLDKVTKIIKDCLQENVEVFYQPGHPLGFLTSIYLAELAVCKPLWDPEGIISQWKARIDPYPDALQRGLIYRFAWEINFSIMIARKSVERADLTYAAGSSFRSIMCMLQVLFAINKTHWLNEKGAVSIANSFRYVPIAFQARVNETFQLLDARPSSIEKAIVNLEALSKEIDSLLQSELH